jgi:hypothetical protein
MADSYPRLAIQQNLGVRRSEQQKNPIAPSTAKSHVLQYL